MLAMRGAIFNLYIVTILAKVAVKNQQKAGD